MDTDGKLLLVGVLIMVVWLAFALWVRRRTRAHGRPDLRSLVILLPEHRRWTVEAVREAAVRAWGMVPEEGDDAQEYVSGDEGLVMAKMRDRAPVLVTSFPAPTFESPATYAASIADPDLRRAIAAHRAFTSVQYLDPSATDDRAVYAHLARLVSEMLQPGDLALVRGDDMVPIVDGTADLLRSESLEEALPELFRGQR